MLNHIDIFALALAAIAFVPGYLAGLKLQHKDAPLLCGFAAGFVIYLVARMLLMIFLCVVVPAAGLWLYFRFYRDISDWMRRFAIESGIRIRERRRPPHVNDAIDRLLSRHEKVTEELSLLKKSGRKNRHVQLRLEEELESIDQTLLDLL